MRMKTLLRFAAVVAFAAFSLAGFFILSISFSAPARDALPLAALGLVFVGTAFFVGPLLLFAAEKIGPIPRSPAHRAFPPAPSPAIGSGFKS
jgi:hypothetical protein